ncbi:MAG: hypothetical protein RR203_02455 [Synergistaceae bacterium]
MSVTLEGAIAYWSARLGEQFLSEPEERQKQALQSAQDTLAPYTQNIVESDSDCAVYEQAEWLLGSRADMQSSGVTSMSISGITESYEVKGRPSTVAPSAWRIIKHGVDGTKGRGPVWL